MARASTTSTTKSERTRERVLSAAASTLSRLGYAGMRLSDVADEAGVQAPAIYYYFESRDRLVEEVVVVGTARLRAQVAETLDAAPERTSPLDRIDLAIEAHLRHVMAETSFAHAVIRNQSQLPPAIRRRQRAEERKYTGVWRELFREAAAAGDLRADVDPDLAYPLVAGALNWATEWWTPRRSSLTELIATAVAIAHQGLAAQPVQF